MGIGYIYLIFLIVPMICGNQNPLRFRSDGTFKIAQCMYFDFINIKRIIVTDLHFGEAENTKWGPQQDIVSTNHF